jgi:UDP-galactopyranose mutase
MLASPRITVQTSVDYFESALRHVRFRHLYFTGPIDRYFADSGLPPLAYRSLRFETRRVPIAQQQVLL